MPLLLRLFGCWTLVLACCRLPAQSVGSYLINTVAGNGTQGFSGDNGSAINAQFDFPWGVARDAVGNLYIADTNNNRIRKVTNGVITTVAGGGSSFGDNGPATSAQLSIPNGVAVDSAGNIYIADTFNYRIRKVANGVITTVAGNGTRGSGGDNGPATSAQLNIVSGVAVDSVGNIYIADTNNNRIRKVTNGVITTVAGNGTQSFGGDNGPATSAQLNGPNGVAVDSAGNLYIADSLNSRIRKITNGVITTLAGDGSVGFSGDKGLATSAQLTYPAGVAVYSAGNVYIDDASDNRIRILTPTLGTPPSISTSAGVISASGFGCLPTDPGCGSDGAFQSTAPGSWIEIYGSNLAGDARTWLSADFTGPNGVDAPTSLDGTTVTIGGQAAFVSYISPTQVNAEVPFTVGLGSQPVTVRTAVGTSNAYNISVNATQPALLVSKTFNLGGYQYVVATFSDGQTYVLPTGSIPGVLSRPAKPGETVVVYGIGFGPVTGNVPAGQIVQQLNNLTDPVQSFFNGTAAATPAYWGLAPSLVGLYQFNLVVPSISGGNPVPLTFTLGGFKGSQTLYTIRPFRTKVVNSI